MMVGKELQGGEKKKKRKENQLQIQEYGKIQLYGKK